MTIDRRTLLQHAALLAAGSASGLMTLWPSPLHAQAVRTRLWLLPHWWPPEYAAEFKKETGIEVAHTPNQSNTVTMGKLLAGGDSAVDVVEMTHPFVRPLADKGLLHPLDLRKIPNAEHMFPYFKTAPHFFGADGKQYGVPFCWGYDSLLFNADHIPPETDSLGVLFDEKYKGRISIRDEPVFSISLTAMYMGKPSPYQLTTADLTEIRKFLIAKKPIFRTLWRSMTDAVTQLKNGEVWATNGWLPMYWILSRQEGMNMRYPVPKEGAAGFIPTLMCPSKSETLEQSYKLINWFLGPYFARSIGERNGYYSTSQLALQGMSQEIKKVLAYDRAEQLMAKLKFVEFPQNLQEWTDTWTAFKAA